MHSTDNKPTYNISINEFIVNYTCINGLEDLWEHNLNGQKVKVIFESDEYFVVYNK